MRHEFVDQADQRPAGGFVGRRNDAVRRQPPKESLGNGAEEDRLEEAGVVEKNDEPDVRPRVAWRVADEYEIVAIKNAAEILQIRQKPKNADAAKKRHGEKA